MNFIQTFWSCNNKDILRNGFGWISPEYHLMSWALSCLQLNQFYPCVKLYTDSNSARIFADEIKLPYSKVKCTLDNFEKYNPDLWALAKIHTYSIQKEPFVNIDGDAFLWKPFEKELLNEDLIAQNIETDSTYYKAAIENLKNSSAFLPFEIRDEIDNEQEIKAYNAGIFGGNDLSFFEEYTLKAFEFVDMNINKLEKININAFNTIYEQYLFYCLAKKHHKKVGVFLPDIVDNLRYKGFADFFEVPYNKKYIHLHGNYKKNYSICRLMANRLRNDYPEYYYRIIKLFKKNNLPLINDSYSFESSITEEELVKRFYFLKNGNPNYRKDLSNEFSPYTSWRSKMCNKIIDTSISKTFPDYLIRQLLEEAIMLDQKILNFLKQGSLLVDKTELYQTDILSNYSIELIFTDTEKIKKRKLVAVKYYEIFKTHYDWALFDNVNGLLDFNIQRVIESCISGEAIYTLLIPECYGDGYSLYCIDELDLLIINELKVSHSIGRLLQKIAAAFGQDELKSDDKQLNLLVYNRIKCCISNKIIKLEV